MRFVGYRKPDVVSSEDVACALGFQAIAVGLKVALGPDMRKNSRTDGGIPAASRVRHGSPPIDSSSSAQSAAVEGPRARLLRRGARALADAELLALVLGLGRLGDGRAAVMTCKQLLARIGGLDRLWQSDSAALLRIEGIGVARACALCAIAELGRRGLTGPIDVPSLTDSARAFRYVAPLLLGQEQELFVAVALDARNRPMRALEVGRGSATGVDVHPRQVFTPLVRERAVSALVAHNHPSGDGQPSAADELLTRRLVDAGELLGIPLVDHLIVARGAYTSMADLGRL